MVYLGWVEHPTCALSERRSIRVSYRYVMIRYTNKVKEKHWNMPKHARVIFPQGFDARSADEITAKGWANVVIGMDTGEYYSAYFFDPVRAGQELEYSVQRGDGYFTEQGVLILIPDVTVEAIVKVA